jgi:AraC-like DNA-binding protein/ligand-binding sensor protein
MDKIDPTSLVQHLRRSRIFEDYERAFKKVTKLPLELSSIDRCSAEPHARGYYTNPFCALLSRESNVCGACLKGQRRLTEAVSAYSETVRCFAGCTNTGVPLRVDSRIIGFLQTGQVFLETPSAAGFKKIKDQLFIWGINLDLVELKAAYVGSPFVSPDRYRAIVRLLEIFAEYLSLIANRIALQQLNEDPLLVRRAKDYIETHQFGSIPLEEIARALNVSKFHFCRIFKQTTGQTFVTFLSCARIEKAKVLLINNDLRISEIAYEVGFQSLTHFNRIFRKFAGRSPTDYRSSTKDSR